MPRKFIFWLVLISFICNMALPYGVSAQTLNLPAPTQLLNVSQNYSFPVLRGLKLDPKNPLNIEFIIDPGTQETVNKEDAGLLIKYFLAALTIPRENLWVNLSPYESDRIIPGPLSQTELGEDMLGQDYLLKQLAASLTYPETEQGKKYWAAANGDGSLARMADGKRTVPISVTNSFNRVWITADQAQIYEGKNVALITQSSLKALTEADYFAAQNNPHYKLQITNSKLPNDRVGANGRSPVSVGTAPVGTVPQVAFQQHILPLINKDINEGKNFAQLRQIYNAVILGLWFKNKFKESFYKNYLDRETVNGIDTADKTSKDKIYNLYVEAFKKGVYNYVKRDRVETHGGASFGQKITRRQYFSGGVTPAEGLPPEGAAITTDPAAVIGIGGQPVVVAIINLVPNAFTAGHKSDGDSLTGVAIPFVILAAWLTYYKLIKPAIDRENQLTEFGDLYVKFVNWDKDHPDTKDGHQKAFEAGQKERLRAIDLPALAEDQIEPAAYRSRYFRKLSDAWEAAGNKELSAMQVAVIWLIHKKISKGWHALTAKEKAQYAELHAAKEVEPGDIITINGRKRKVYRVHTGDLAVTECSDDDIRTMFTCLEYDNLFTRKQARWLMDNGWVGDGERSEADPIIARQHKTTRALSRRGLLVDDFVEAVIAAAQNDGLLNDSDHAGLYDLEDLAYGLHERTAGAKFIFDVFKRFMDGNFVSADNFPGFIRFMLDFRTRIVDDVERATTHYFSSDHMRFWDKKYIMSLLDGGFKTGAASASLVTLSYMACTCPELLASNFGKTFFLSSAAGGTLGVPLAVLAAWACNVVRGTFDALVYSHNEAVDQKYFSAATEIKDVLDKFFTAVANGKEYAALDFAKMAKIVRSGDIRTVAERLRSYFKQRSQLYLDIHRIYDLKKTAANTDDIFLQFTERQKEYFDGLHLAWFRKYHSYLTPEQFLEIAYVHFGMEGGWRELNSEEAVSCPLERRITVNGRVANVVETEDGRLIVTTGTVQQNAAKILHLKRADIGFTDEQIRWLMDNGWVGEGEQTTGQAAAVAVRSREEIAQDIKDMEHLAAHGLLKRSDGGRRMNIVERGVHALVDGKGNPVLLADKLELYWAQRMILTKILLAVVSQKSFDYDYLRMLSGQGANRELAGLYREIFHAVIRSSHQDPDLLKYLYRAMDEVGAKDKAMLEYLINRSGWVFHSYVDGFDERVSIAKTLGASDADICRLSAAAIKDHLIPDLIPAAIALIERYSSSAPIQERAEYYLTAFSNSGADSRIYSKLCALNLPKEYILENFDRILKILGTENMISLLNGGSPNLAYGAVNRLSNIIGPAPTVGLFTGYGPFADYDAVAHIAEISDAIGAESAIGLLAGRVPDKINAAIAELREHHSRLLAENPQWRQELESTRSQLITVKKDLDRTPKGISAGDKVNYQNQGGVTNPHYEELEDEYKQLKIQAKRLEVYERYHKELEFLSRDFHDAQEVLAAVRHSSDDEMVDYYLARYGHDASFQASVELGTDYVLKERILERMLAQSPISYSGTIEVSPQSLQNLGASNEQIFDFYFGSVQRFDAHNYDSYVYDKIIEFLRNCGDSRAIPILEKMLAAQRARIARLQRDPQSYPVDHYSGPLRKAIEELKSKQQATVPGEVATSDPSAVGGLTWDNTKIEKFGDGNFYFENIPNLKEIKSMGFVINSITPNKTIQQFLN